MSNCLISCGAIKKINRSIELEDLLKLTNVAEKHLMESAKNRILKTKDLETVFDHFVTTYFTNDEFMIFYGEKFVDYNQMANGEYLRMVCETELYSKLKFYEEKLLINSLDTFSSILKNFGNVVNKLLTMIRKFTYLLIGK